jgi:hypothetical protein
LRFSREDRETLLQYLVANFGPAAQPKAVKIDKEIPLDEAKLGKAAVHRVLPHADAPVRASTIRSSAHGRDSSPAGASARTSASMPKGNVWLTDRGYPNRLVKLDPRTGAQKAYVLPDPRNGNHDVNIDRTGMIWLG